MLSNRSTHELKKAYGKFWRRFVNPRSNLLGGHPREKEIIGGTMTFPIDDEMFDDYLGTIWLAHERIQADGLIQPSFKF